MANNNQIRVDSHTPIGRIVQGGFEGSTTDADGKPLFYKSGKNAGQPRTSYFIALAVAKNNPEWPNFLRMLHSVAAQGFPAQFDGSANSDPVQQINYPYLHELGLNLPKSRDFSFKIVDGDGRDTNGDNNADKEGFAGHWVLRFSSSMPFKGYMHPSRDQLENPGQIIKRGYFARIAFSSTPNTGETMGIYVNPDMILCVGYGHVIIGGKDFDTAFKGLGDAVGGYVPAGMSTTPTDGMGGTHSPAQDGTAPPAAPQHNTTAPPGRPAPAQQPNNAAAGAAAGAPNQQFVDNAGRPAAPNPPAPPGPPAPPAPTGPVYTMTALAEGFTRQQWHDSGWTDEALLAAGKMTVQQ